MWQSKDSSPWLSMSKSTKESATRWIALFFIVFVVVIFILLKPHFWQNICMIWANTVLS
jgi:hypothetical protein